MQLRGKTALIAGAGRNNGKAIALTLAREGADLILVARHPGDEVKQVAKECESLGVRAVPISADVSIPQQVNDMVQLGLKEFGKVDVLVCSTGIRPHRQIWEYGYDEWQQVFAVNLHSTFYLAKALVPGMIERKSGSIIALGSTVSLTAHRNSAVEVASKHGLYGLIKSLALDLGPYGIRANLICPGNIEHPRSNPEWYANDPSHHSNRKSAGHEDTPLRRAGTTQEVANVALFLASDESSYVTGDRILCVGGRYM